MSESQPIVTHSTVLPSARWEGDALIGTVKGDVDLRNSPELRTALISLIKEKMPAKMILDVSGVSYMDSSAIAVLVEMLQKTRKSGGKVYLVSVQPRVKGLLEIARLDQIFVIAKDVSDALAR